MSASGSEAKQGSLVTLEYRDCIANISTGVIPTAFGVAYLGRFTCCESWKNDEPVSHRRFKLPGSYVLATVSCHILGLTNEGVVA